MFDNAYGCAGDAVSIRRNAFLAVFTSIELIFLDSKISQFLHQVFVLHLISPMKVKSCSSVEHNTAKYRLEKCQFNIGSNGTQSVLDTPDLWANIVVYVTVEFPIPRRDRGKRASGICYKAMAKGTWLRSQFFLRQTKLYFLNMYDNNFEMK